MSQQSIRSALLLAILAAAPALGAERLLVLSPASTEIRFPVPPSPTSTTTRSAGESAAAQSEREASTSPRPTKWRARWRVWAK